MAIDVFKEREGYKAVNSVTKEEALFESFDELISKIEIKAGVNIFLPAEDFCLRKVNLPKLDREKIKEILPFEMEDKFLDGTKNLVMDFIPLSEGEKEILALVFAIEKDSVERYIKPFDKEISSLMVIAPYYDESLKDFLEEEGFRKSELNFIPKEYLGLGEKYSKLLIIKKVLFYLLIISTIFLIGEGTKFFILKKKESGIRAQIASSATLLSQGQKVAGDPISYVQAKLLDLKGSYKSLKGIDVLDVMKGITNNMPPGIRIKELNGEGVRLVLKGDCKDSSTLEQFRNNILKSFRSSNISETKNLPDGTINFTLEVDIDER